MEEEIEALEELMIERMEMWQIMNDNDCVAIMMDVHTNSACGNEAFLER